MDTYNEVMEAKNLYNGRSGSSEKKFYLHFFFCLLLSGSADPFKYRSNPNRIYNTDSRFLRYLDPGGQKVTDPGSGSATLN